MKILVAGPSWVGDMVMAQSLFISLAQQYPGVAIDVLAPSWCEALLAHMPQVRQCLSMPVGHGELALGKRRALGKTLAAKGYDQAIVLPNSFKSALVPWFAGIALRTGWRGEARGWLLNDCRKLDKSRYPLMVQRFVALAFPQGSALPSPLPVPKLEVSAAQRSAIRQSLGLQCSKPVLVLCTGAEFGPAKQWPAPYYAEVADHYLGQDYQVWLLGSERDHVTAELIRSAVKAHPAAEDCRNLCGATSLGEALALLAQAAAVVSNDSGLMHVAAALNRPLVVVYGSTSAEFTPPLADRVQTLSLQLPCSPCFKRHCPLGHLNCLKQLHPARVIDALAQLLEGGAQAPAA